MLIFTPPKKTLESSLADLAKAEAVQRVISERTSLPAGPDSLLARLRSNAALRDYIVDAIK